MQATTNSTTSPPNVPRGRPLSRTPSPPPLPTVENREYDVSYLGYILDSEDSRREKSVGGTTPGTRESLTAMPHVLALITATATSGKKRQQSRSPSPSPSKRQRRDSVASSSSSAHSKHSCSCSSSSSQASKKSKKSKSSSGSSRSRKSRRERIRREVLLEYFEGIEEDLTCPMYVQPLLILGYMLTSLTDAANFSEPRSSSIWKQVLTLIIAPPPSLSAPADIAHVEIAWPRGSRRKT
jgi:hypothetical protein